MSTLEHTGWHSLEKLNHHSKKMPFDIKGHLLYTSWFHYKQHCTNNRRKAFNSFGTKQRIMTYKKAVFSISTYFGELFSTIFSCELKELSKTWPRHRGSHVFCGSFGRSNIICRIAKTIQVFISLVSGWHIRMEIVGQNCSLIQLIRSNYRRRFITQTNRQWFWELNCMVMLKVKHILLWS